jgi:hypothetical protein
MDKRYVADRNGREHYDVVFQASEQQILSEYPEQVVLAIGTALQRARSICEKAVKYALPEEEAEVFSCGLVGRPVPDGVEFGCGRDICLGAHAHTDRPSHEAVTGTIKNIVLLQKELPEPID